VRLLLDRRSAWLQVNARRSSPDRRVTANRRTADKLVVRLRATAAMPEQVALSLLDKPMIKTKTKTKIKTKPIDKTPKAHVWAVKIRKLKSNAWMPDEVVVDVEGDYGDVMLFTMGWTTTPGKAKWTRARIEKNLGKLKKGWEEDVGKGWRLEIR
jgi:hypothetical protein